MRATSLVPGSCRLLAGLVLVLATAWQLGCSGDVTQEPPGGEDVVPTDPNAGTETNVFPVPCSRDADCGDAGQKCIPSDASTGPGLCEIAEP
jgi:hypothetical protein